MTTTTEQLQAAMGIGKIIIFGKTKEDGVDGVDRKMTMPYDLVHLTHDGPVFVCGCNELATAKMIRSALELVAKI